MRRQAAVAELGEINAYESKFCSVQTTFIENETPFVLQLLTMDLNSRIAGSLYALTTPELEISTHIE